ncbi:Transmembrane protein 163 [Hondaea fermentalgiana]|uniref:Transmembrane protein 163 n=1 Tax=Hondaea fermentalgiana TaxID=2315210 RepID=A0A2R5GM24_9STRA|nr:Transmembrane protein 163 [Hondaea fermentalgiana]|eukprot:GBG30788.1 Transmembrane protein 163 [Hondaea fermentalgiana]
MELADGVENLNAHERQSHAFAKDIGEIERSSHASEGSVHGGASSVSSASTGTRNGGRATAGGPRAHGKHNAFFAGEGDAQEQGGVLGGRHPVLVRLAWLVNPGRWIEPTPVEARVLSYLSIAVSLLAFSIGAGLASSSESSAMLAFALEALVDVISSIVVLWRFHGSTTQDEKMQNRELRAAVGIGLSFILSGFVVLVDSIVHLSSREAIVDVAALLGLSIPSWILLLSIGMLKLFVANKLKSDALFEDGICSIGSSTISMSIWISIAIHRSHPRIWYLDGVVALVIGIGFIVYGVFIVKPYPFWTRAFWLGEKYADATAELPRRTQDSSARNGSGPSTTPPPSFGDSYTTQAANV